MKQLNLSMELEASSPPPVTLEPSLRAQVVAQLAQAIIAVQQNEKDKTNEQLAVANDRRGTRTARVRSERPLGIACCILNFNPIVIAKASFF